QKNVKSLVSRKLVRAHSGASVNLLHPKQNLPERGVFISLRKLTKEAIYGNTIHVHLYSGGLIQGAND
ncbi:MAG TPA: hypothetical protein PLR08_04030, partial [bacterium]|nr:hypothetical protein [bacterium]